MFELVYFLHDLIKQRLFNYWCTNAKFLSDIKERIYCSVQRNNYEFFSEKFSKRHLMEKVLSDDQDDSTCLEVLFVCGLCFRLKHKPLKPLAVYFLMKILTELLALLQTRLRLRKNEKRVWTVARNSACYWELSSLVQYLFHWLYSTSQWDC